MKKEFLDFCKDLERLGYQKARSKGSHFIYVNPKTGKTISVNKDLNKMVSKRLRKEATQRKKGNAYAEFDD